MFRLRSFGRTALRRPLRTNQQIRFASTIKSFDEIPGPADSVKDLTERITTRGMNDAFDSLYMDYGEIVRMSLGGENHVYLYSPSAMMHVFKNDEPIPQAGVVDFWPIHQYGRDRGRGFPLMEGTERWKEARPVVQKDLFSPQSASTYLPNLDASIRASSKVLDRAPLEKLMPHCAFDMFCSAILGRNFFSTTKHVDPDQNDPETDKFVKAAMESLALGSQLMRDYSPEGQRLRQEKLDKMYLAMDIVHDYSVKILREFKTHPLETPEIPYIQKLVDRNELPFDDVVSLVATFLFAGVDTTSHLLLWAILNLARFPDVQEKLYQEIIANIDDNAPVTTADLDKMEYMRQFMRESHRLTPTSPITTTRTLTREIELCGYKVPAGTKIQIGTSAFQMDPKYVDQPQEFRPERWTKEAVKERKGTPAEQIDLVIVSKPYSLGPRMCPGARLADSEVRAFLCRMVRDWKFEYDPAKQPYYVMMGVFTQAFPYPKMTFTPRKK